MIVRERGHLIIGSDWPCTVGSITRALGGLDNEVILQPFRIIRKTDRHDFAGQLRILAKFRGMPPPLPPSWKFYYVVETD